MTEIEENPDRLLKPFCWACLERNDLISLCGSDGDFRPVFKDITSIEISDDEPYAAFMCETCLNVIKNAQKIKIQCLEVNLKLRMLKNTLKQPVDDITVKVEHVPTSSEVNDDYRKMIDECRTREFDNMELTSYIKDVSQNINRSDDMGSRKFYSLAELEEIVDYSNFIDNEDSNSEMDIVELPPVTANYLSDVEDTDDNILEDNYPKQLLGRVEVHSSFPRHTTLGKNNKCTPSQSKIENIESIWKNIKPEFSNKMGVDDVIFKAKKSTVEFFKGKSPVEIFETLFDDNIMDYIVQQSILYAFQNNRRDFKFSPDCLRKFLGILLLSGYHSLPNENMYWCEDEDVSIQCVRKCLSRNRYIEIKRNLHFNNNAELINSQCTDNYLKISPLLDKMNQQFMKFGVFSKNISINKQIIQYYDHRARQFMGGKPVHIGFKQWVMCCSETGYCFNTELYQGRKDEDCQDTRLGAAVILRNIMKIDNPSNHCFYFNEFFTSFELMKTLRERNIAATGAVRYDRMNSCPVKDEEIMKKESCGEFDHRVDIKNDIFALVWKDFTCVRILSTHEGLLPLEKVIRWSNTEKKHVEVSQPQSVNRYSKYVGGVDKLDAQINKYRIKIRAKNWYFPIFTNIIDLAVINAHVLYCFSNEIMPLVEFRRYIAKTYLSLSSTSDPKNAGRRSHFPNRIPNEAKSFPNGHYIVRTIDGKQRRCAVCKKNVRKQCSECNVGIHIECMKLWHE